MPEMNEHKQRILEELDNFFDWADQIKDDELERWKIMYGCEPKDLKDFFSQSLDDYVVAVVREIMPPEESRNPELANAIREQIKKVAKEKFGINL